MDKLYPNQKAVLIRNMNLRGYEIVMLEDVKKGDRLMFHGSALARLIRREQDGACIFDTKQTPK